VRFEINTPRWQGVPILIRAGKYLADTVTEVLVTLKPPPSSPDSPPNTIRFRLKPDVTISISARAKRSGESLASVPVEFTVVDRPDSDELDEYERLLGDAMEGDETLFARADTVNASWQIVQPVLGDSVPVHSYEIGTWGPREAERLARDVGGWHRAVP
jgi:glucose-6-phosphate 1-dehydrogenase